MVRRLRASFSGSLWVGNGLDGELAQLVPRAGLTSAQTDAVIPPGTTVSSRSRSLKAELRRRTTFPSCTPPYLCTCLAWTARSCFVADFVYKSSGKRALMADYGETWTEMCP